MNSELTQVCEVHLLLMGMSLCVSSIIFRLYITTPPSDVSAQLISKHLFIQSYSVSVPPDIVVYIIKAIRRGEQNTVRGFPVIQN